MELDKAKKLRLDAVCSTSVQYNVTKILDGLYVGGRESVDDLAALEMLAVTHIVNCTEDIPNFFYGEYEPMPCTTSSTNDPGTISYLRVPISDDPDVAIDSFFQSVFGFIQNARDSGKVCLVHCSQGMSRSPTFILAYLVARENMSVLEALRYTRALRPVISPNVGFMRKLVELEVRTRQKASLDLVKYRKDRFATIDELVIEASPSPAD
ncbi:unnamed protein product [Aphanomyces euteiches]|uniref:protein-tyrosine-phosphatase n=1 Tax=Aphanomyces euteiches TaxID=100861 RepID=A0A6G0X4Z4_9STRA|nr:hypothetical protein Ae201684_008531 [Aphanomyces euteiches]KAH9115596.1 hypothetical protein AeMF1_010411 [Aphanomyces euteiches]KAH9143606.1 hypothetical protein AeRB84_012399 [Aphanomyces euteiches]KAH9151791.1 hypothetical protein LEN26_003777 [Aphanomyces euteiches]KAH9195996.1 hypothetical protein AeNC1_002036 [Aphanomyces euteiches]